jgi:hypothetical protein
VGDHVVAARAESLREPCELRRLAAAVQSLEGEETSAVHARVSARGSRALDARALARV